MRKLTLYLISSAIILFILFVVYQKYKHSVVIRRDDKGNIYSISEKRNFKNNGLFLEYNDSCNIAFIGHYKNGLFNGLVSEYFKNGLISSNCLFKDGRRNGRILKYYPNGILEKRGQYYLDNEIGEWFYFDSTGTLITTRRYIIINGKSRLNEVIKYNNNIDTIIALSNYVRIIAITDTIASGEEYSFKIVLESPYYKSNSAFVVLGEMNNSNEFVHPEKTDTFTMRNYTTNIVRDKDFSKPGLNSIRGIVYEIEKEDAGCQKTYNRELVVRPIYFEKKYYVVE